VRMCVSAMHNTLLQGVENVGLAVQFVADATDWFQTAEDAMHAVLEVMHSFTPHRGPSQCPRAA
jgi:peptide subunit release factor 1 (eRF1)